MPAAKSASADISLLESFWSDAVHRSVLPNGLTLLVKPDRRAAIASVQVWVKTGSIHEDRYLGAGLSHYLEHMLFKGTARRTGREITTTVQAHGGYINAYTTFDRTVYHIDIPAEHAPLAVDLLADMMLRSTLTADDVAKEKDVILREIDMVQDEPDQRLGEALFATAFREHPYRHPIIGHRDVFAAVGRDDLLAYYRERYVPNNFVVVIVGDVDPGAMTAAVTEHFGAAPRVRLAPVLVPDEPRQLAPRAWHRREDVEVSRAGLAWQIPGLADEDTPALDVLAMILGAGDSSLLWQAVREQARLVHHIDATCWNPGSTGLFYISYTCDDERRAEADRAIERELHRAARGGITPARLRQAVRQLVVGEINTRKTMGGQASRLGVAEVVVGDLDFSRTYFARLAALTPADIRRVLTTYLVPSRRTSVSLNPMAAGAAPAPATAAARAAGEIEEIILPNGARLLLQPDASLPNLHLRVCGLGGPCHEAADRRGATSLMATLMTKDTKDRTAVEVARFVEEAGGSFYPISGNNTFGVAAEFLPSDLTRALDVLEGALFRPAFPAGTVAIERDAQLAALREADDDVVALGRRHLRRKFFGLHPLAIDAQGDEAGVAALRPRDLAALHRRLVVAPNIVMSVAGDFSPRTLATQCRRLLGRLPKGAVARPGAAPELPAQTGEGVEIQPRQQAIVFEAYPAPTLLAPDFYVGEVMDELFSGMSSRLFERVRDELGLAYFVRSSRIVGLDAAMFYFYAGTAPGSEPAVYREIAAEIARVAATGVEPAELERCQVRLKAARRMSLQTNSAKAMQSALNALYGLPVDDWRNYDERIGAVTRQDLAAFARRYFTPARRLQLTVRP